MSREFRIGFKVDVFSDQMSPSGLTFEIDCTECDVNVKSVRSLKEALEVIGNQFFDFDGTPRLRFRGKITRTDGRIHREISHANDRVRNIVEKFASEIENGKLKPGDKLPPTTELMAQFKVSVNHVVAARKVLKDRGLVEIRPNPNSGTYVI